MRAIRRALCRRERHATSYPDEADVDFNPRIDACWTRRGRQMGVATPAQSRKHYVAGALHAHTGKLVWAKHRTKKTTLFIKLLEALLHHFPLCALGFSTRPQLQADEIP
ncbi:MAG: hypothetical protein AAF417_21505 [Pseudomonadota bacterium]